MPGGNGGGGRRRCGEPRAPRGGRGAFHRYPSGGTALRSVHRQRRDDRRGRMAPPPSPRSGRARIRCRPVACGVRVVSAGVTADDPPAHRSETVERYLEAIYYIEHEGEVPRPGRLAEWLGVSAPTVSVSLQRLPPARWGRGAGGCRGGMWGG